MSATLPPSGDIDADRTRKRELTMALQAAVPLNIARINAIPEEDRPPLLAAWRQEAVAAIPEKTDVVLCADPKKRKGETAYAFSRLAMGLAALAYHRGGFMFAGLIWCAAHSPAGAKPTEPPVCARCLADERAGLARLDNCPCCVTGRAAAPPPPVRRQRL